MAIPNQSSSKPSPDASAICDELVRFFSHRGEDAGVSTSSRCREIVVDAMELFDEVPGAWSLLLKGYQSLSSALKDAAQAAAGTPETGGSAHIARVRLVRVPHRSFARSSVAQLRVGDDGQLVRICGTITRAGPVKVVQEWRNFRCEQCGHSFGCRASAACGYDFEVPRECPGGQKQTKWDPKAKRPKVSKCHSKLFASLPHDETCMADFQEIRVQDDMQAMGVGVVPQSCAVTVFGDLVGVAQPGDAVMVEGLVFQRWRPTWQGKRVEVEMFIEATNVERLSRDASDCGKVMPETEDTFRRFWSDYGHDEWQGRAALVTSTAPWLSGLPVPKLALLLTLVGGSAQGSTPSSSASEEQEPKSAAGRWGRFMGSEKSQQPDGSIASIGHGEVGEARAAKEERHTRTTPHLLLLGDPGTGKSQLLQAAQELTRSVRTSGLGCTSAGLTCAAVRDGADWVLEAGALVLADGGVCCIDEFSTIRSHDKAAVHEAMEQQTVSVAKAGLVCRLRSRCSVVAAQNCRGAKKQGASYDLQASVAVNSGLPPPLLSRFDLVVVFAEGGKGVSDSDKADFIIDSREPEKKPAVPGEVEEKWNHSRLRQYVAWAKERRLDEDDEAGSATLLQTYFGKLRSTSLSTGGTGGVTARTLESLVRLSQAHAKLMNHRCVQIEDAVAVVLLHRASLQDHVVGAESGLSPTEDFAPSMRDLHDETAACGVHVSLEGLGSLNHGTDIVNKAIYGRIEQAVLRSLKLCRSRNDRRQLVRMEYQGAVPLAIADIASPQVRPTSLTPSPPASQVLSPQPWPNTPATQRAEAKPRGRQLGCRLR